MFKKPQTQANTILTAVLPAVTLLEKRGEIIDNIRDLSQFDQTRFSTFVIPLLKNIANNCQSLPETVDYYFAHAGGLLDYALIRTRRSLETLQQYLIIDEQEGISEQQLLWTWCLLSASILKGIGKLQLDFKIELFNARKESLHIWKPLLKPLSGNYYTYEFISPDEQISRANINLLIAKLLIPENGFAWIASNNEVLATWLALINEEWTGTGSFGSILIYADSLALNQHLHELLQKYLAEQQHPGRISSFLDVTHEDMLVKERMLGLQFLQWIQNSLKDGTLAINKFPLNMENGVLRLSNETFRMFLKEHPACKQWHVVKRSFLSLNLHNKIQTNADEITINNLARLLPDEVSVMTSNENIPHKISATEVIRTVQNAGIGGKIALHSTPMQYLNAKGQWQASRLDAALLMRGSNYRA